ncbi:MAG: hypothetical protein E6Q58_03605 [Niabella sp.]|nr:MAG: hypothetical protein E6Q58_03605 [Niabella sp.]
MKDIYVTTLCVSGLICLLSFRRSTLIEYKIILLLILYSILVEVTSIWFRSSFSIEENILPQYNLFLLVEFLFYGYFFQRIINNNKIKQIITIFLCVFPVVWYFLVFGVYSITEWNSYVFIAGSSFMIFLGIVYYNQLFNSPELSLAWKDGLFWIVTGILLFYACGLPYMGMYSYLKKDHISLAVKLKNLLQLSNIIMYSLFAYAFICQLKMINTRKSIL